MKRLKNLSEEPKSTKSVDPDDTNPIQDAQLKQRLDNFDERQEKAERSAQKRTESDLVRICEEEGATYPGDLAALLRNRIIMDGFEVKFLNDDGEPMGDGYSLRQMVKEEMEKKPGYRALPPRGSNMKNSDGQVKPSVNIPTMSGLDIGQKGGGQALIDNIRKRKAEVGNQS